LPETSIWLTVPTVNVSRYVFGLVNVLPLIFGSSWKRRFDVFVIAGAAAPIEPERSTK